MRIAQQPYSRLGCAAYSIHRHPVAASPLLIDLPEGLEVVHDQRQTVNTSSDPGLEEGIALPAHRGSFGLG